MKFTLKYFLLFFVLNLPTIDAAQISGESDEFNFASKLYDDRLYDVAVTQLEKFLTEYPASRYRLNALKLLGDSHFNIPNFSEARRVYIQLEEEYHGTVEAENALMKSAEASAQLGDFISAAVTFKKFTSYYPNSSQLESAFLASGFNYLKAGISDLTESILLELLESFPESQESLTALTVLAGIYENQRRDEEALDLLEIARKHKHSKIHLPLILHSTARIQMRLSDYEAAGKSLSKLSKLSLGNNEVQKGMLLYGELELSNGNQKSAYKKFKSVEKKATGVLKNRAILRMGDSKVLMGKFDEAEKNYRKINRSFSTEYEYILLQFRRGFAAENRGDIVRASVFYKKVVSSDTEDSLGVISESLKRLITVALDKKDPQIAVAYCLDYLSNPVAGEKSYFAFKAGEIYRLHLNLPNESIEQYKISLRNSEKNELADDAVFGLALSQYNAGLLNDATEELNKLRDLYPGSSATVEARKLRYHIDTYMKRENDLGFERLAELMGDLLSDKPREELFIELAGIYSDEMKDYKRASELLKNLLKSNPSDDLQPAVLFMLGELNLKLSEISGYENKIEMELLYKQAARSYLTELLSKYPHYENISSATYHLSSLSNASDEVKLKSLESFVNKYPKSEFIAEALLSVGSLYAKKEEWLKSRRVFERIIKGYPGSGEAEEASMAIVLLSIKSGSPDRKKLDLSAYIRRYPNGAEIVRVKYLLGNSQMASGEQEKAMSHFTDIVQNYYYSEYVDSVSSKLGLVYFGAGEYEKALNNFLSAGPAESWFSKTFVPRRIPKNDEEIYYAAVSAEKLGKRRLAKSFYRKYLQKESVSSNSANAAFALLSMKKADGGAKQTKLLLRSFIAKDWNSEITSKFHEMLAELYFKDEDYTLARSEYEIAKDLLPDENSKKFILKILSCYYREGKLIDAERVEAGFKSKYLNGATDEERALLLFERGSYYVRESQLPAAKRHFKEIIKNFAETDYGPLSGFELSLIAVKEDKKQDALDRLMKLEDDYPESYLITKVYLTIGQLFTSVQQYNNAIEYFKKTIDHPNSGESRETAYRNLVRVYEEAGLIDPALTTAQTYLEIYPNSKNLFSMKMKIGNLLMNVGDYDKAVEHWEALLPHAESESSAEILFWTGESYFNKGEYSRAITEYLKVSYLGKPSKLDWSASAWWKAGNAYEELGEFSKSVLMYDRIIQEKGAVSDYGRYAKQRIESLRSAGKIKD
ncbi:MAG: tetratricopeptide repeat protein [Candidatus Marinimicrobia bacterium]|nr:tetratricopeptide repeat protein [Candidatus Neomarinimicrobiota bacterium]